MTENKRFYLLNYKNYPIYDSLNDKEYNAQFKVQREKLCLLLNELNDENKELKDKNSQLQEILAFRSNQLALMEQLIDDLGSDEMARQMEEILND